MSRSASSSALAALATVWAEPRVGRVDLVGFGVRTGGSDSPEVPSSSSSAQFAAALLQCARSAGSPRPSIQQRVGAVEVAATFDLCGDCALVELRCSNASSAEIVLDAVSLGLRWSGAGGSGLRFLRNGWQSWSYTGVRDLDPAGEPAFASGEWLRGMHHVVGAPGAEWAGWHESAIATLVGRSPDGPACVLGALETGRNLCLVYLREEEDAIALTVEQRCEVRLKPGESIDLECVFVALGTDGERLLERFGERWGRHAGARTTAPFQSAWCSWYHFFHEVTEDDVLRNLEVLAREGDCFGIDVVQIDDGFQRATGDWLETNPKFPRGLGPLASDIRSAGFRAGIWTAPFCAVAESRVFEQHRDWLLRCPGQGDELFRGLLHPEWSASGSVFALDPTQQAVQAHLEALFRELRALGFDFLKLDFVYVIAMAARASDPRVTRAGRLRSGLAAIRSGSGEDAFLLGCGSPLGPAVGIVDAMRIGPDVGLTWDVDPEVAIPGIETAQPSLHSSLRSTVHRAWMHRRLWLNDPDCLMVRSDKTMLTEPETESLAAAVTIGGGVVAVSDDLPELGAGARSRITEVVSVAREIDAASSRGAAVAVHLLSDAEVHRIAARVKLDRIEVQLNLNDQPVATSGSQLAAHAGRLDRIRDAYELALFCDFDGTFSVEDVGTTLARRHLSQRRAQLWERFEAGGFTAWSYAAELFAGFVMPEDELMAFLKEIQIDPGARDLMAWCRGKGLPFRILSDGFDANLDRLQAINDLHFEYNANHLEIHDGRWHLEPGAPDPSCVCGTGSCKRGLIRAYRALHPRAVCVHVGNGRVSDLCGAVEADLAFAKDTLAPAMEARGEAYEPFETLHDVIAGLDRWV